MIECKVRRTDCNRFILVLMTSFGCLCLTIADSVGPNGNQLDSPTAGESMASQPPAMSINRTASQLKYPSSGTSWFRPKQRRNPSNSTTTLLSAAGQSDHQASALLEALLETVYSAAAQPSGRRQQGACLVGGALHAEGSAVISEGNAYCQYCYCIRQRIVCMKPKCNLVISGCTPKYNDEYACCPSSYSCTPSSTDSPPSGQEGNIDAPQRISSNSSKLLASRPSILGGQSAEVAARQADVGLSTEPAEERLVSDVVRALVSSLSRRSGDQEAGEGQPISSPNASTSTTSTTSTTTSTTTTSTTTTTTSTSTTTTPKPAIASEQAGETKPTKGEEDEDAEDGDEEEQDSDKDKKEPPVESEQKEALKKDSKEDEKENKKANKGQKVKRIKSNAAMKSNETAELPHSASDFLEPMNKLGPQVASPNMPTSCIENGRSYAIGEQIPAIENCKHCYCGIDGVKDCKMVECRLKEEHDCKPVIPKGHCCPARYICPSSGANGLILEHRHRSVDDLTPFQEPFKGVSQCESSMGADCASHSPTSPASSLNDLTTPTLPSIADIAALNLSTPGADVTPLIATTRIVDNDNSFPPQITPDQVSFLGNLSSSSGEPMLRKNSSSQQPAAALSLTEELNKFIMQINGGNMSNSNMNTLAATTADPPIEFGNLTNSANLSQEMMINDQRSRMVDYHSVQGPGQEQQQQQQPQQQPSTGLPAGIFGIPSIQPEPIRSVLDNNGVSNNNNRLASMMLGQPQPLNMNQPSTSFVEYSTETPSPSFRDSRSTNDHRLPSAVRVLTDNHRVPGRPVEPNYTISGIAFDAMDQPEPINVSNDDYLDSDGVQPKLKNRTQPHMRLLNVSNLNYPNQSAGGSTAVMFDDELANSYNASRPMSNAPRVSPFHKNLLTGANLNSNASEVSTPMPPQPTTGTPFGVLETGPREQKSYGWLQSFAKLFGNRLNGADALQGAASVDKSTNDESSTSGGQFGTARSKEESLLEQLFKSMLGTSSQQSGPPVDEPLVMKPLASVLSQIAPLKQSAITAKSPYEPGVSASNVVEIVTAAVPNDPEFFMTSGSANDHITKDPASDKQTTIISANEKQAFAKRTDLGSDLLTEIASSVAPSQQQQATFSRLAGGQTSTVTSRSQPRVLVCTDPVTNKTFQPNELIPKEDPCQTCSCVLGEERCQTLVCPERPAENCSEERQPGQCCPSYLCGNNLTQLTMAKLTHYKQSSTDQGQLANQGGQMQATQRALHVDQMVGPAMANGIQLADMAKNLAMLQGIQASRGRNTMQNQQVAPQRSQLPQNPIRTSELLPSYLNFKPNFVSFPNQHRATGVDGQRPLQARQPIFTPNNQLAGSFNQPAFAGDQMAPKWRNDQQPNEPQPISRMSFGNIFDQINQPGMGATVRAPILPHPRRSQSYIRPFIAPSDSQASRRSSLDEPSSSQVFNNQVTFPTQGQNTKPPDNLLMPRMSAINQPLATQLSSADNSPWRPTNGIPVSQNVPAVQSLADTRLKVPSTVEAASQAALRPLSSNEPTVDSLLISSSAKPVESNELGPSKITFPEQPPSSTPVSTNTGETGGFRPMVLPSSSEPSNSDQAVTQETTTGQSNGEQELSSTSSAIESSPDDTTVAPRSTFAPKPTPALLPETTSSSLPTRVAESQTESSSSTSTPMDNNETSGSSETSSPVATDRQEGSEVDQPSSTTNSNVRETIESNRAGEDGSKQAGEQQPVGEQSFDSKPPSWSDPLAMFRVSECNIYGRIYKVGQTIDELSDVCKRCTCTSMGVDCQSRCR